VNLAEDQVEHLPERRILLQALVAVDVIVDAGKGALQVVAGGDPAYLAVRPVEVGCRFSVTGEVVEVNILRLDAPAASELLFEDQIGAVGPQAVVTCRQRAHHLF